MFLLLLLLLLPIPILTSHSLPSPPPLLPADEAILRSIFKEGGGAQWKDRVARESWTDPATPPCQWRGVVCGLEDGGTGAMRVRALLLRGVGLTALPEVVGGLEFLEDLEVSWNKLGALPAGVGGLKRLTTLACSDNLLAALPESIGQLESLEGLDLSSNRLESLPESLGDLANLGSLKLGGNRLRSLPGSIGRLKELSALNLGNNMLQTLPDAVWDLASITSVDLSWNRIEAISAISRLKALRDLYLQGNLIRSLPEGPGELPQQLETLILSRNRLQTLPESLGALVHLNTLDVSHNELQSLPTSLGSLSGLISLDASNNQLASLPEAVGALPPNLRTLGLSNNRLQAVPASLGGLRELLGLSLDGNLLQSVPDTLGQLPKVDTLNLQGNRLQTLPALNLTSLITLLGGNNSLAGAIQLCAPSLASLELNDNPLLARIVVPSKSCISSLTTLRAAGGNLTSLAFLGATPGLVNLDVSHNPFLGNDLFKVAKLHQWPALQSLKMEAVGAEIDVMDALSSAAASCPRLISLDLSFNPGITGQLVQQGERGIPYMSALYILRLSGTSVSLWGSDATSFFPSLRVLAIADAPLYEPLVAVDQQPWSYLEQIDVTGDTNVRIAEPVAFPGTPYTGEIKFKTNSVCPTQLIGGLSRYAILCNPSSYLFSLCQCIEGYFGEPWNGGCLECPAAPSGETALAVDCSSEPGSLKVTGGWILFGAAEGRVEVVPCPSDTPRSPCVRGSLGLSLRNLSEWDSRVVGARLSMTTCAEGYEGRLCSRCQDGYFRSGRSCFRCGGKGLSWLSPVLSVVVLTALGVKSVTGGHRSRSGLIRTLVMHAQLVALLPDLSLRLSDWSGFFVKSASSGAGDLRLNGLECEGKGWDGFYGPFAQAALLPALALVGSAWIALVSGYLGDGRAMGRLERLKAAGSYLWLVFLFGSMQRLLAPLNCTSYGSTHGNSYLASALWIPCSGGSFRWLRAASVVLGFGYMLGTIALVAYSLRPSASGQSVTTVYLRSPYRPESYYWEAVQLVRRVALAMTSSLTPLNSPAQPVVVSSVLILSLLAHTWKKPYQHAQDNVAESVSLTLLLSSYMAGLIASNPRFPSSATSHIGWLFLASNALFLAALTVAVLFRTARSGLQRLKQREDDDRHELEEALMSK